MLASADDTGTGTQTIGPISADGRSLLYLAIQQDYSSGGAPAITDSSLTWSLRTDGSNTGSHALWVYTSIVPISGISSHAFTIAASDSGSLGYVLIDFQNPAGFDPEVNPLLGASSFSSTSPSKTISTNSPAVFFAFVSTIAATGSVIMTPLPGEDILNGNVSPSYAVAFVYGAYNSSTDSVGGTLSSAESGWIISDAVDLQIVGNTTITEISAANMLSTGTHTVAPFSAAGGDLLYLAVAQDFSGGVHPFVNDSSLTWTVREGGAVNMEASEWIFTTTVPAGGFSAHSSLKIRANDGGLFGYLLVDLSGYSGFDPNLPSVPSDVYHPNATTISATVATGFQAVALAFVSTNGAGPSVSLTPSAGQEVMNGVPSPSYGVALLFANVSNGSVSLGGTFSHAEAGWILTDAVDLPYSGNLQVSLIAHGHVSGGPTGIPSFSAPGGSLLYLAINQDDSSGSPPTISDTGAVLVWTAREDDGTTGGSSIWVYTAVVPYGGISSHTLSVEAHDAGNLGYILVELRGFVSYDGSPTDPGVTTYSASKTPSTSVVSTYPAIYMAFISTNTASGSPTLTPNGGETVLNSIPSPSYAVSLVYEIGDFASPTIGGSFPTAESGWILWDAVDA
jgi:hypothetical protein